jgi:hypothetical protein
MASLVDTFAALVVEIKELTGLSESQFLSFPAQPLPFNNSNLALEDPKIAFAFALLVNTIPDDSPQFVDKADFIWRVYQTILEEKNLAPEPIPERLGGVTHSMAFHKAIEVFGIPRERPDSRFFYNTSVLPIDLDNQQIWTHLAIDNTAVQSGAVKLDEVNKAWLGQFRLLGELGESFVEAVTCEIATISVVRPWLDPDVFEWRFWDMPDTVFSDGKIPVNGELPCIISKMVIARNIKVIVSTSPLPQISNTAMLHKRTEASGSPNTDIITQLVAFSSLSQKTAVQAELVDDTQKPEASELMPHFITSNEAQATVASPPIDKFANLKFPHLIKTQFAQSEQLLAVPPSEIPAVIDAPIRGFHVPFSFETEAARTFWTAALASAEAEVTSLTAQQVTTQANIPRIRGMIIAWQEGRVTDHRTPVTSPQEAIATLESGLAQEQQVLRTCEAALSSSQANVSSIKNTLNVLMKLSEKPVDPESFVLAMACTRTPKCPNPDSVLFGNAASTQHT